MDIYRRIKNRRLELGMTQGDLAKKLGYTSRTSIAKIEAGENDIPQSKIVAFAKALDTNPSYLMGIIEEKEISSKDLEIPEPNAFRKVIPIVGRISAGNPSIADQEIEGFDGTDDPSIDFALRVRGDSMINAGIFHGSLVYVDQNATVTNGDIAITLVNGYEATIKRFYRYGNKVVLRPENSTMQEQVYDVKEVKVLGKVKAVKTMF